MKSVTCGTLASLVILGGCVSWERPYVDNDGDCDEIVDARERLDCYDRAAEAEDEWREEKRRESDKHEDKY